MNQMLQTFQEKYEALAGIVHPVQSFDEALKIIEEIIGQEKAQKAAIGPMPDAWRTSIENFGQDKNFQLTFIDDPELEFPQAIDECPVGISRADYAIADTGTLVEFAGNDASRLVSTLPRVHIALVEETHFKTTLDELAPIMREAFNQHTENYTVTFISGPSRSGDIAMQLTLGVHGPQISHVIVLQNET